jgi:hypothetical protein
MSKLVNLTLTDYDCLTVRLALNGAAMEWGEKASAYRKAGQDQEAATCERIRSDYHRLWEAVNVAQEAAPDNAPVPTGRTWKEVDAALASDKASVEARATARAQAMRSPDVVAFDVPAGDNPNDWAFNPR